MFEVDSTPFHSTQAVGTYNGTASTQIMQYVDVAQGAIDFWRSGGD